jgi:hypothetical protein
MPVNYTTPEPADLLPGCGRSPGHCGGGDSQKEQARPDADRTGAWQPGGGRIYAEPFLCRASDGMP